MVAKTGKRFVSILLLALAVAVILTFLPRSGEAQTSAPKTKVVVLELDGIVSPATADYLIRGLAEAQSEGAALVVIQMDTPGGLDTSMRDVIGEIIASPVPVAVWVGPGGARAASAGAYILYASHIAAMAPGTNVGAATPIQLGGGMPFGEQPKEKEGEGENGNGDEAEHAPKDARSAKMINDAVAYIRSLADLRGRNAEWAEKAVRQAASLPAREALEKNVIELIASDLDDLLAQIDGRKVEMAGGERTLSTSDATIVRIEPDWRTELLSIIAHPNVAFILLAIGIYGIIFEFASPGMVAPGVIGAICLLLGLFALNVMPIDYAGIALMLLGIGFMVAEAFAPSFGVLGLGGSVAFAVGAIMAFDTDVPGYELSIPLVIGLTATTAGLLIVALAMLLRSRGRTVETGSEALIGTKGCVLEWSGDRGQVRVHGERWLARSPEPLSPGQTVTVAAREGFLLQVKPTATAELSNGEAECR